MRCKACDVSLKNVRDRDVDGVRVTEDLCHRCLESAMSAIYGKDLDDDALFALEVLSEAADTERGL